MPRPIIQALKVREYRPGELNYKPIPVRNSGYISDTKVQLLVSICCFVYSKNKISDSMNFFSFL